MSREPLRLALACAAAAAAVVALGAAPPAWRTAGTLLLLVALALLGWLFGRARGRRALPWAARGAAGLVRGAAPEPWPFAPDPAERALHDALVHAAEELDRARRDGQLSAERAAFDGRREALERLAAGLAGRLAQGLAAARIALAVIERQVAASNENGAPVGPAAAEAAGQLQRALDRSDAVVQGLRALAPAHEPAAEPSSLGDVLEQAVADRRARAARLGIVLDVAGAAPDVRLPAAPGVLGAVVGPLLDNALDALEGRGGTVRLRVERSAGEVVVTVEDDGPGLAPGTLERAFDPLFTTRTGDGLGLGLAFARAAAARCGGSVALESPAGRGARAIVRLPRHAAGARA